MSHVHLLIVKNMAANTLKSGLPLAVSSRNPLTAVGENNEKAPGN